VTLDSIDPWAVNIAAGLIVASVGVGASKLQERVSAYRRQGRPGRELWRFQVDKDHPATLILTNGSPDVSEMTETVYPAEVKAAIDIYTYLDDVYPKKDILLFASGSTPPGVLSRDLIVLGGPVHNSQSAHLMGVGCEPLLDIPFRFEGYILQQTFEGNVTATWVPSESGGHFTSDYGLVVLARNPHSSISHPSRLVLLAGCRTNGCLAAARSLVRSDALSTSRLLRETMRHHGGNIAFVVKAVVSGGEVTRVDVIEESITGLSHLR